MSEYVHEDKTTVHEYVTSPSLDPVTASTPDVHGGYPVNPLGFPNTNVCDGGDRECLGKGNPEFPQSRNFSVEMGDELPDGLGYVEVATNVSGLSGTEIHLPVEYLKAVGNHEYQVTVIGDISVAINTMAAKGIGVRFANAGYDDYSVTGIITKPTAMSVPGGSPSLSMRPRLDTSCSPTRTTAPRMAYTRSQAMTSLGQRLRRLGG